MNSLSQIWQSSQSNPSTLVSFISAIAAAASATIAIFAVVTTSGVSLFVARRQIRASLISGNRQAWINALRDDLAELLELLEWLALLRPGTYSGADGYKFRDERRSRIRFLKNRIRLRLNPNEHDHEDLLKSIDALENAEEPFLEKMTDTVKLSQGVLKREWVRVKRGR